MVSLGTSLLGWYVIGVGLLHEVFGFRHPAFIPILKQCIDEGFIKTVSAEQGLDRVAMLFFHVAGILLIGLGDILRRYSDETGIIFFLHFLLSSRFF
jgi:hypothetical protein